MTRLTILRLHVELLFTKALLWCVSAGKDVEPRPETHLYLADLHFRLALAYEGAPKRTARKRKAAKRHRILANRHAVAGPPQPLPPAAAMAMPVPPPYRFTDARGRIVKTDN